MKLILYYLREIILKTFHKKKYYERSPSNAIKLYMKRGLAQKRFNDGMREMQLKIDNNEELKKIHEEITRSLTIEKISAKNLKVESLEDRKDKGKMDALEKLKQILLYKEIARVNGDVLFLKDGTRVEFYMSDND